MDRSELEALVGELRAAVDAAEQLTVHRDDAVWRLADPLWEAATKAADAIEALLRQDMAPSGEQDQGLSQEPSHTATVATPKSAATDAECVELKPCPFCGEAARESVHDTESLWSHDIVPWLTIGCDDCDFSMCSEVQDELREKWNCRALPDHQPSASGEGWVSVPREPPIELLMSMAVRQDHGLGVPGYYDQDIFGAAGISLESRVRVALGDMRKVYEEVVGDGFYRPEHARRYQAMMGANGSTKPTAAEGGDRAEDGHE